METLIWDLRTLDAFTLVAPILFVLAINMILAWDYPVLGVLLLVRRMMGSSPVRRDGEARALPVLVVIPSLLRQRDELTSVTSSLDSVAGNGYPGDLTIVVSIDGTL